MHKEKLNQKIQTALYEIARRAITANGLDDFLSFLYQALSELVPSENMYVALYDREKDWVTVPFSAGDVEPELRSRPRRDNLTDYVLARGRPFRLSADSALVELNRDGYEIRGRVPSDWLGIPLVQDGLTIGALVLRDFSSPKRYSEADQELLTYVAGQIAVLIQRKQMEVALKESEERFRRHFNEDITGDFAMRPDGAITDCNKSFADMFGYPSEKEALSASWRDHFSGEDVWQSFIGQLREHRKLDNFEFELRRKDGSTAHLLGKIVGTWSEPSHLLEIRGYLIDITERVQLHEQFLQSQKMEAIGRLAEGIAHDFNNLLTPIIGYGRLILDKSDIRPPFRNDLEQIVRAGERASDLTRRMLGFGRKQDAHFKPTDINRVVRELENLLRRTLGPDINLILDLENGAGAAMADDGQLEQVIMNLAVNARDALSKGGRLKIQTRGVLFRPHARHTPHGLTPGEYVLLSVQDNGCGMPLDVQKKAFDPFFTTKAANKGTGLGLSTVYGIIQQFKGFIDLNSKVGQGTTMNIYLPRVDTPPQERQLEVEDLVPRGTETILLVEDDDSVRETSLRILESLGYKVIQAKNGGEAILVGEQYAEPIHLLLTDVVMPMMTGSLVARRLGQIRRDFKVLYTSGYALDNAEEMDPEIRKGAFIQKPCTHRTLGEMVRRVLDGKIPEQG